MRTRDLLGALGSECLSEWPTPLSSYSTPADCSGVVWCFKYPNFKMYFSKLQISDCIFQMTIYILAMLDFSKGITHIGALFKWTHRCKLQRIDWCWNKGFENVNDLHWWKKPKTDDWNTFYFAQFWRSCLLWGSFGRRRVWKCVRKRRTMSRRAAARDWVPIIWGAAARC